MVVGSDLGSEPAVKTSWFLFVSPVYRHIPNWVTTTRVDILSASLLFNLLKPNDIYVCRTAALTSRRYILNIYSRNIHTDYFKHAA